MGNCEFCMGKRVNSANENTREHSVTSNNTAQNKRKNKRQVSTKISAHKNGDGTIIDSPLRSKAGKAKYTQQKSLGLEKNPSKKDNDSTATTNERKPGNRKAKKCVTTNIKRNDGTMVRGIVKKTSMIDIDQLTEPLPIAARSDKKKSSQKINSVKKRKVKKFEGIEDEMNREEDYNEKDSFESAYDDGSFSANIIKLKKEKPSVKKVQESRREPNSSLKVSDKEENLLGIKCPPRLIISVQDSKCIGIISDHEEFKQLEEKKDKDDMDGYNSDTKDQETGNRDRTDSFWKKVKYRQSIKVKKLI